MRRMADSVTPMDIPTDDPRTGRPWDLVAGYIDGVPRWPAAAWDRFPGSVHVRIALDPATNDGHVLDVENGAANPDQAPGWVMRRRAAGADPTVYCNLSLWPTVREQFAAAGVPEPHWWIAAYPGIGENLYPGTVAHQYANPLNSGGHLDLTVVADHWPGVDGGNVSSPWDQSLTLDDAAYPPKQTEKAGDWLIYLNRKASMLATAFETFREQYATDMAEIKAAIAAMQPTTVHVEGDLTVKNPPA